MSQLEKCLPSCSCLYVHIKEFNDLNYLATFTWEETGPDDVCGGSVQMLREQRRPGHSRRPVH